MSDYVRSLGLLDSEACFFERKSVDLKSTWAYLVSVLVSCEFDHIVTGRKETFFVTRITLFYYSR